jgi:hypothetical protein
MLSGFKKDLENINGNGHIPTDARLHGYLEGKTENKNNISSQENQVYTCQRF